MNRPRNYSRGVPTRTAPRQAPHHGVCSPTPTVTYDPETVRAFHARSYSQSVVLRLAKMSQPKFLSGDKASIDEFLDRFDVSKTIST